MTTSAVRYRSVQVDGLSIFYREAGRVDAPTILLLHRFPSSSRMFNPLLERLSGKYHLVAPDYPGFGHSDHPDPASFAYTFDHLADVMDHVGKAIHLSRYSLYMQDYGGPVGFRLAIAPPGTRTKPDNSERSGARGRTRATVGDAARFLG